jgi:hypothetical protein
MGAIRVEKDKIHVRVHLIRLEYALAFSTSGISVTWAKRPRRFNRGTRTRGGEPSARLTASGSGWMVFGSVFVFVSGIAGDLTDSSVDADDGCGKSGLLSSKEAILTCS